MFLVVWHRWGRQIVSVVLSLALVAIMIGDRSEPIVSLSVNGVLLSKQLPVAEIWLAAALVFSFYRKSLVFFLLVTAVLWSATYFDIAVRLIHAIPGHEVQVSQKILFVSLPFVLSNIILFVRATPLHLIAGANLLVLAGALPLSIELANQIDIVGCAGELSPAEAAICAEEGALQDAD